MKPIRTDGRARTQQLLVSSKTVAFNKQSHRYLWSSLSLHLQTKVTRSLPGAITLGTRKPYTVHAYYRASECPLLAEGSDVFSFFSPMVDVDKAPTAVFAFDLGFLEELTEIGLLCQLKS